MTVEVIRPGLLTSVQDLGRFGMQHFGVPVSGAMDGYALRVANRLAGNEEGAAALELTLAGPVLEFGADTLISLSGGDLEAMIDGKLLPMNRPVWVARGRRLSFGRCIAGCRAYLAFAGGIDVAPVLGSRSTYVRAALGGLDGRALKAGDRIAIATGTSACCPGLRDLPAFRRDGFAAPRWSVQVGFERLRLRPQRIRFVAGRHWEYLEPGVREAFTNESFQVGRSSDRMGYRLDGVRLKSGEGGDIASEAVAFGTIQLPPDGNPIILMADRQTIGGYPRLGEVASADLPLLAQLKPGDSLRFERIALADAQRLAHAQAVALEQIAASIGASMSE
jgi:antagonist of KipI